MGINSDPDEENSLEVDDVNDLYDITQQILERACDGKMSVNSYHTTNVVMPLATLQVQHPMSGCIAW